MLSVTRPLPIAVCHVYRHGMAIGHSADRVQFRKTMQYEKHDTVQDAAGEDDRDDDDNGHKC